MGSNVIANAFHSGFVFKLSLIAIINVFLVIVIAQASSGNVIVI